MADITNTVLSPQLHNFWFWCQKVLPLVYDDSLSYYEMLCKVRDYINDLIAGEQALMEQVQANSADIEQLKKEVAALNYDEILHQIDLWITNNLDAYLCKAIHGVIPYLDADGYFRIAIPKSWSSVEFSTVQDPESECYGHLVIKTMCDDSTYQCFDNMI